VISGWHWKFATRIIFGLVVVCAALAAGQVSSGLQFKITGTGAPVCSKNVVRVPIVLTVSNPTDEPLVIGRITVVRESFYRKDQGVLHPIRDNPDTEEFLAPEGEGLFQTPERHVWAHSTKQIRLERPIAITPTDIQRAGARKSLLVSFVVSNMQRGGKVTTYTTEPHVIGLPATCNLGM